MKNGHMTCSTISNSFLHPLFSDSERKMLVTTYTSDFMVTCYYWLLYNNMTWQVFLLIGSLLPKLSRYTCFRERAPVGVGLDPIWCHHNGEKLGPVIQLQEYVSHEDDVLRPLISCKLILMTPILVLVWPAHPTMEASYQ